MQLFKCLNGWEKWNIREIGDEMSSRNPKPFLKRLRENEMPPNRCETRTDACNRCNWQ
jgi:hypothetical protein